MLRLVASRLRQAFRVPSRAAWCAAVLSGLGITVALPAQSIRGRVVDRDQRPMAGVVISVLDSAETVLSRALSDERGEFRMLLPRAATVRLRAQRIGLLPTRSGELSVAAGATITPTVIMDGAPVRLTAVKVSGRNRCGRALAGDTIVSAVWNQAQTSLAASAITASTRGLTTTLVEVNRVLDGRGKVLDQQERPRTENVVQPWRSLPADTLRARGYVWLGRDDGLTYNAPGLDALVSPAFQQDHCFRLAQSKDTTEIGLAFEPAPERFRVADISGTLWLDRETAALRRADFTFGTVPGMTPSPYPAGGTMRFAQLPTGAALIDEWELRLPVLFRDNSMGATQLRVDQVQVTGGRLTAVRRGTDTLYARGSDVRAALLAARPQRATLTGRVTADSGRRAVEGAEVAIGGVTRVVRTNDHGEFRLEDLPEGTQQMTVRKVGFMPFTADVMLAAVDQHQRVVDLQPLTLLDSVEVVADRPSPWRREFEDHRKLGLGWFRDRAQLERLNGMGLQQVLGQAPDLRLVSNRYLLSRRYFNPVRTAHECEDMSSPFRSTGGDGAFYIPMKGDTLQGIICACYAQVVMDGRIVNRGPPTQPFDVRMVTLSQIEAIEWFSGPAQLPTQYGNLNATCGVLVLHTRELGSDKAPNKPSAKPPAKLPGQGTAGLAAALFVTGKPVGSS